METHFVREIVKERSSTLLHAGLQVCMPLTVQKTTTVSIICFDAMQHSTVQSNRLPVAQAVVFLHELLAACSFCHCMLDYDARARTLPNSMCSGFMCVLATIALAVSDLNMQTHDH